MIKRLINQTNGLERALDAAWTRNEAISQNIANVDTPDYKKIHVTFEGELQKAIAGSKLIRTKEKHINTGITTGDSTVGMNRVNGTSMRVDGNNVDIDEEMSNLAKNTIYYNAVAQKLSMDFRRLRSIINEGKR